MVDWPTVLPAPEQSNYEHQYEPGNVRTEMEGGPARIRPLYRDKPEVFNVSWLFNAEQKSVFDAFYYRELDFATKWFVIAIMRDNRNQNFTCRFFTKPNARLLSSNLWQVSAKLEAKKRLLITTQVYQTLTTTQ